MPIKKVGLDEILPYLPEKLRKKITRLSPPLLDELEEIRLRNGLPVALRFHRGEYFLTSEGKCSSKASEGEAFSMEEMHQAVLLLSNSSFYAMAEELRRGYITLTGGHRAGLCGRAVLENGYIKHLTEISSINIRLARWIPGTADQILPLICHGKDPSLPYPTLLVSPPRAGKTTILRDLARQFSIRGFNVGIVDERSELAAMLKGKPQFPIGPRSDVLDACPKAEGMMLMIRSMSPEIIICDEIGREEDAYAIREVANAGVIIIASAHGSDKDDLLKRPVLANLLAEKAFDRIAFFSRNKGPGTLEYVLDANLQKLELGSDSESDSE
ncbi:MAG: stage III sporulation protein AA [Bacillota bacterium]